MLKVEGLQASYGRSQVLFDIDLEVGEGEIVTLLGRNGMGKTTTIRSVMGLTPPSARVAPITARSLALTFSEHWRVYKSVASAGSQ